jgi:hypothetical protein
MGMYVQNVVKLFSLLVVFALLGSCGPMDGLLSSAGTYKVSVQINGSPRSFIGSGDRIRPYFEETVEDDPDVTALVIFLKDSRGNTVGWKVFYVLDKNAGQGNSTSTGASGESSANESGGMHLTENSIENDYNKNGGELVIRVQSLDDELPIFPVPNNLPMGRYTIVSHVMSGTDILQRTEKTIFYLGETVFDYNGINVHLPGVAESVQLIPRGTVIMLEAGLDFDSRRIDPYIVWYDGRSKISEGKFSSGAGYLFWKSPEQSGFFSLSAEIFPTENYEGLTGYQKEISLFVPSKEIGLHLISENIPQLTHWYVFEGNLNDSKMITSAEMALRPSGGTIPRWMPANGTYGLATGHGGVFTLPNISVSANGAETWRTLFRFKVLDDGGILSVLFDPSHDVSMQLTVEGTNLILTLASPRETVSQTLRLPSIEVRQDENLTQEASAAPDVTRMVRQDTFLTAGINFSITSGLLSAQLNIMGDFINSGPAVRPIALRAEIEKEFQILLGSVRRKNTSVEEPAASAGEEPAFTALWDEFALYYMPPTEILTAGIRPSSGENRTEAGSFSPN